MIWLLNAIDFFILYIYIYINIYKLGHSLGSLGTSDWALKWQIWAGFVGPDGAGLGFKKNIY